MIAWSSSRDNTGFANAGRNTERIRSALSRPPLPWPRTIVSLTGCGAGQLSCASELGFSDIVSALGSWLLALSSQLSVLSSYFSAKHKLPLRNPLTTDNWQPATAFGDGDSCSTRHTRLPTRPD